MRTTASFLRILGFAIFGYFFLDWMGTEGETSIFVEMPWIWAVFGVILMFYIAAEISLGALHSVLFRTLKIEDQERIAAAEKTKREQQLAWLKSKYRKLLGSKPIEEEDEIILDHNYDGIQELDNNLPPWWVYGFYATIIFAGIYLARFHIFGGDDQKTEYEIAMAEAKKQIEEYKLTAKDLVDASTVELLTEASDIEAGESIFAGNCIACHKEGGAGGIGPNLTDDYWINGGGIKNVFNTISEGGRPGKGMIAWKTNFKPSEIAQVASYVLSLHGTNPVDPKEPEGEIWKDENSPIDEVNVEIIDSTTIEVIMDDKPVDIDLTTED